MRTALAELLDQAIIHVSVYWPGTSDKAEALAAYKNALLEERRSYSPDLQTGLLRSTLTIVDESVNNELLSFLRRTLSEYVNEDRIQLAFIAIRGGISRDGVLIGDLLRKLIDLAFVLGTHEAADRFLEAIRVPECEFKRCMLLGGITIERDLTLYDSVTLTRLPESSSEWPNYLPGNILSSEFKERFRGAVILVDDYSISPRFMNPVEYLSRTVNETDESPFRGRHKSHDVSEFLTLDFFRALSLTTMKYIYPSIEWKYIEPDEIVNVYSASNIVNIWKILSPEQRVLMTKEDIHKARKLYEQIVALDLATHPRLLVAIDRLILSTRGKSEVDRVIDLGIALESLYVPDQGSELSFRLKTRAARYLETDHARRLALAYLLRAFYNARSHAVHRGNVRPEQKVKYHGRVPIQELISSVQDMCRRSIVKMLDDGLPEWDDLDLR